MTLYTESKGPSTAPTIVFLHGMSVSSWMWTQQVEVLSQQYHTLAIDLPGNGESYQTEWHSLADSAAQVAAVIRGQATGGKAHVVGLSLGGYVALELLNHHPEVVESVIVSGVTARPLPNGRFYRVIGSLQARLAYWSPLVRLMAKMMNLPDEAVPLMIRDTRRLSRQTVGRVYEELLSFSLPDRVSGSLQRRLLAVAGEAEVKLILDSLTDFLKMTPAMLVDARVAPGGHHGWAGELPDLFNRMIAAWVEAKPLPTELQPV